MKKTVLLVPMLVLAMVFSVNAQSFTDLEFPTYKNGSNGAGGFTSGSAQLVNYYDATYNSWAGFAVSKASDTQTGDYTNQFSAVVGSGANSSANYMVSYISSYSGVTYIKFYTPQNLISVDLTNSTYAHHAMRDGDFISKQFGGVSGDDPDYFLLSIKGYNSGFYTDSVGFYLADFQDANNVNDYILDVWQTVSLSSLGLVDSLVFNLTSTDNGTWGMNTPAYFCMDNLVTANETLDFEEYDFDYWNGEDRSGSFTSMSEYGPTIFYNTFNPSTYGGYWTGFAYSRKTDITSEGYSNQYSAITGVGVSGNQNYIVGNGSPNIKFNDTYITGLKITNSTYAALSMQNGDAFAKQFGGTTGNDPDWFLLTIEGFEGITSKGTVAFYLADYRFVDNNEDYIVDTWSDVDLSVLGYIDSLSFSLSSSDVGTWGMNTPAYFCIGEITTVILGTEELTSNRIKVYPNPAKNFVIVESALQSELTITDISGKVWIQKAQNHTKETIDLSAFDSGVYILSVKDENGCSNTKIIKE